MNLVLLAYLVGIINNVHGLLTGVIITTVLSVTTLGFLCLISTMPDLGFTKGFWQKPIKWMIIVGSVASILQALLPDERTAWMMLGAYTAQEVLANPTLQQTTHNIVELINAKIVSETASIKKDNTEEAKK